MSYFTQDHWKYPNCQRVLTVSRLLEELPPDGGEEVLPGGDGDGAGLLGTHVVAQHEAGVSSDKCLHTCIYLNIYMST